jgi:hypothetical protein
VLLVDYDDVGRSELEFTDADGLVHSIYVKREFIVRLDERALPYRQELAAAT